MPEPQPKHGFRRHLLRLAEISPDPGWRVEAKLGSADHLSPCVAQLLEGRIDLSQQIGAVIGDLKAFTTMVFGVRLPGDMLARAS